MKLRLLWQLRPWFVGELRFAVKRDAKSENEALRYTCYNTFEFEEYKHQANLEKPGIGFVAAQPHWQAGLVTIPAKTRTLLRDSISRFSASYTQLLGTRSDAA